MLFGLMVLLVIGGVAVPLVHDLNARNEAVKITDTARAARAVFAALQNARLQRGPIRTRLTAQEPASASFLTSVDVLRTREVAALQETLRVCGVITCSDRLEIVTGLPVAIQKAANLRPEVDVNLRKPLAGRRAGLETEFNAAATDVVDRLEAISTALTTRVRMVDASIAELVEIKQLAWLARDGMGFARSELADAIAAGALSPTRSARYLELNGRTDASWSVVRELASRPGVSAEVTAAIASAQEEAFDRYGPLSRAIYDALAAGKPSPVTNDALAAASGRALDALTAVPNTAMRVLEERAESNQAAASASLMFHLGLLCVGLLVGVVGLIVVERRIAGPITAMTQVMRTLAAGDHEVSITRTGRRDEIGAMTSAVQVFKDNLVRARKLEAETALARASAEEQRKAGMRQMADSFEAAVGGIVGMVSSSATELQATAQQMTSTASETASQSTSVATAAEEAATNVNTVAAAAEELGSSVQEIGRQVAGSAQLARTAVDEASQTAALVQELNGAVSRIGDVVTLISTIAGQTNLLALNATIEAARAGAAGKGFAVVASEVKALAEQTARATSEISGQIARIQGSTGQAVTAIGGISARIREINAVAASIAAAVEQQGAATQEIVRNVAQAAQGTGEVTSNIVSVARASEETGAAASQVLGAASELSRQSEQLASEMSRFLATVRAA